ncbi:MAG: hypothetical protein U0325_22295 [Polyangiales bacterium]
MNRFAYVLLSLSLAACSSPTSGGGGATDAGTTAGNDVVNAPADSGTTTPRDSGTTTPRDSGTTTRRDSGPADPFNYGMCGRSVIQALCMCNMTNQSCQQAALQRSMECVTCMGNFQSTCCPAEITAVQDCFTNSGCMDQQCATRMCMSQINTATMCVQGRLQREAMAGGGACVDAYIGCLGDLPTMQTAVCGSF